MKLLASREVCVEPPGGLALGFPCHLSVFGLDIFVMGLLEVSREKLIYFRNQHRLIFSNIKILSRSDAAYCKWRSVFIVIYALQNVVTISLSSFSPGARLQVKSVLNCVCFNCRRVMMLLNMMVRSFTGRHSWTVCSECCSSLMTLHWLTEHKW